MRRTAVCTVTACLLLAGVVAGEGSAKPRRHKVERTESGGYVGSRGGSGSSPEVFLDEVVFDTESHERRASLVVDDRTGQAVAATVLQDADGDGTAEAIAEMCGATSEPVAITGGVPLVVKVRPGPCKDGTPAAMTSGSVVATFTN